MKNDEKYQSISKNSDQLVRHYQIPVSLNKEEVLNTILTKIREDKNPAQKITRKIHIGTLAGISIAASVAIFLAFHFLTASVTISGKSGESLACRLPDNSRIIIQNESEINYKKYFFGRQVKLLGTAYFEVETGNDFIVKTRLGSVEVLGTRFLVSELIDSLNVQCFEGQVKANISKNSAILTSGTQFSGTKSEVQKMVIEEQIEYPVFARFDRKFSNSKITEVASELEGFFGVKIEIQNGSNRNFTGTIQTGRLDSSLDIVCESMQLKYSFIEKNRIIIYK